MDHETKGRFETEAQGPDRETLVIIRDQTRQTLELVKALVELLLSKEGGREGPTLEDLLAVLIAQQRDIVTVVRHLQTEVMAIAQHVLRPGDTRLRGAGHPNGGARA